MAFKPKKDQDYYLIAKHSGKPIGAHNSDKGSIKQKDFDPEDIHVKFRFDLGHHFSWMLLPPFRERYLAVNNQSHDDKTPIIQWVWETDKPHTIFKFLPAGNGYYRIMALHSSKFFDVFGADIAKDALVVQHKLMPSDNQLFKPVAVGRKALGPNPMSFVQSNEIIRTAVLGLVNQIPDVGGALKFIVSVFWKEEDKLGEIWTQMKNYVDVRVKELILEQKLVDLEDTLSGLMDLIQKIDESTVRYKGLKIEEIVNKIVLMQPQFLNKPLQVLPYTMALGTIMITLRHNIATKFKDLYGYEPDATTQANNLKYLRDDIKEYSKQVAKARKDLFTARMGKIRDTTTDVVTITDEFDKMVGGYKMIATSYARDDYDNWSMSYNYVVTKSITTSTEGYHDHKVRADFMTAERRKQAEVQYNAELDELLLQAKFWKYFDPAVPRYEPTPVLKTVGAFGVVYSHNKFNGQDNKSITKIVIHSYNGGNVCGIEVFYNNTSDGLKGTRGHVESSHTLKANEYFNTAYGFAKDIIEGLWFSTNQGNIVGGGTMNGRPSNHMFIADMPDSFNPKLKKISGSFNGNTLENLTFQWEYIDEKPTVSKSRSKKKAEIEMIAEN